MRGILICALSAVSLAWLSGCHSVSQTPYEVMLRKAAKMHDAGALAAVAQATSRAQDLACDKAQLRGRAELARVLEARINTLQKDFREEAGSGKDSEINDTFSEATKILVSTELRGSTMKDVMFSTANGLVTATVIMVIDPKIIADYFKKDSQQYARFRSSQAFKELDNEVAKYEEFKRADKSL